ncbi:MAG TPA: hypothetical protein VLA76_03875 [Candidatus Angelobacter sp.]|nr:hypothetical protein [Candidatus Angelobacter sp.]
MIGRVLTAAWLAIFLAACATSACPARDDPIDPAATGQMLPNPAPHPVECRGLGVQHCTVGAHADRDLEGRFVDREIERVVVSCIGACDEAGGEFRIDVVFAQGEPERLGIGGYGEYTSTCD